MSYLYFLQSKKTGRYYIGSTNDLDRRFKEHCAGKTKIKKIFAPVKYCLRKGIRLYRRSARDGAIIEKEEKPRYYRTDNHARKYDFKRAHSIAVERFHGMEQVRVRLPVGPH